MQQIFTQILSQPTFLAMLLWLSMLGFVVSSLVQLIYLWGVFGKFSFHLPQPIHSDNFTRLPPVTVLICARNEADNLRKNLPSILTQDYPKYEVLVVDDDSDDETSEVLELFQLKYSHLRIFRRIGKYRAGKKDALTDGIEVAKNEYLVLTDADCQAVENQWIKTLMIHFQQKKETDILLGYGGHFRDDQVGFLNKWIRWETVQTALLYFSLALKGIPYMGVGRNLVWKKQLFYKVGGFESHTHLASGDDDLFVNAAAQKHNTAICFAPETFTFSSGKSTWQSYFKQKTRHLSAAWSYRWEHIFLLGIWSLSHTLHYLCMLILLIFNIGTVFVVIIALMRMISVLCVYVPVLRKLREQQFIPFIPIFDFLMAVHYLVFAPILLFFNNKSHTWT